MEPDHGGSAHVLGILDSPAGVSFTPTETNGRSNALINYVLDDASRSAFLVQGTIALAMRASREHHVSGELWGENYGFDGTNHGQGTFSTAANRVANGPGAEADQFEVSWKAMHNGAWYTVAHVLLDYDRSYVVSFVWGGPQFDWREGGCVHQARRPIAVSRNQDTAPCAPAHLWATLFFCA